MNWFKTDDIRIQDIEPLISPAILIKDYPATTEIAMIPRLPWTMPPA